MVSRLRNVVWVSISHRSSRKALGKEVVADFFWQERNGKILVKDWLRFRPQTLDPKALLINPRL